MNARRLAALITLVALALALAGCDDDADESTTTTTSSTTDTSTTTTGRAGPGVDQTVPGLPVEAAGDTVRAWVVALAEGDLEAAWELVAERSRAAIGGYEAFSDLRSALAEGFGAWAGADEDAFSVVPLETGGDEALAVVILQGTIAQEGPPAPAADAVAVRTTSEGSRVEPFLDLGRVEHQPPPGRAVPADATLEALVPMLSDVHFVVDDRAVEIPPTEDAPGDRQLASLELDGSLEPGPHSLTVVLTNSQGEIASSTALYPVEE